MKTILLISLMACLFISSIRAQDKIHFQKDFPPEEFQERRNKVYDFIGDKAITLIQGEPSVKGFNVFRQSNTFYYLTGIEIAHSYLLIDGRKRQTTLFLPHRDESRERGEGKVLSVEDAGLIKELTGIDKVQGYEKMGYLGGFYRLKFPTLYTPFSPSEAHMQSRDEILSGQGRQFSDPWDNAVSRRGQFIQLIRERYPQYEIKDLSPFLDEMRAIKSKREIDLIRIASEQAGLGIMEAIRSTKPGVIEYQLDAAANFVFSNNGSRSEGYRSITASGTNAYMGHYWQNNDVLESGELILMDVAPDYRYYTSDVARMWPVSGKYSSDQRTLYGFIVKYRNVLLKYIRPGITADEVMDLSAKEMQPIWEQTKFSKKIYKEAARQVLEFRGHMSHPVGMAVHDIGLYKNQTLKPGMVFSIDPMMWIHEERLYIRMEDVVVVTEDGVENLSDNIPAELDELEALIKEKGIVQLKPAVFK